MPIRIHWPDTDPASIVWYGNFFRYFEEAEEEMFRMAGRDRNELIESLNIWMPRVEVQCRFRSPARVGELVEIAIRPEFPNARRVKYPFEFAVRGRLVAEGTVRVACVDRTTFKAREFPPEIVTLLKGFTDA